MLADRVGKTPKVCVPWRQLQKPVASLNVEQVMGSESVLVGWAEDSIDSGAAEVVSSELVSVIGAVVAGAVGQKAYAHLPSPELFGIVESIDLTSSLVQAHIVTKAVSEETEVVVAEHDKSVGRETVAVAVV